MLKKLNLVRAWDKKDERIFGLAHCFPLPHSAPALVRQACPGLFNSFFCSILGIFVTQALVPSGPEHAEAKPHGRKALLVLKVA